MAKEEPDEKYYCPECLEEVNKEDMSCPHCKAEYEVGEVEAGFECMICNSEVDPNAKFCPRCGTTFMEGEEEDTSVVKQIGEHGRRRAQFKEMEMDED